MIGCAVTLYPEHKPVGPIRVTDTDIDEISSHADLRYWRAPHGTYLVSDKDLKVRIRLAFGDISSIQNAACGILQPTLEHVRTCVAVFFSLDIGSRHGREGHNFLLGPSEQNVQT